MSDKTAITALPSENDGLEAILARIEKDRESAPKEDATKTQKTALGNSFKMYSKKWPLGPEGYFYNSKGDLKKISEMSESYLQYTINWIDKQWPDSRIYNDEHPQWLLNKYGELEKELDVR